jgi:hypothetical protein
MQMLKEDHAAVHDKEKLGFYDFHMENAEKTRPLNYYADQLNYLKLHIGQRYPEDQGVASNHRELIDRCFRHNSVEEVMESLKKEEHPFAKTCLAAM